MADGRWVAMQGDGEGGGRREEGGGSERKQDRSFSSPPPTSHAPGPSRESEILPSVREGPGGDGWWTLRSSTGYGRGRETAGGRKREEGRGREGGREEDRTGEGERGRKVKQRQVPYTCKERFFAIKEASSCLSNKRILFSGDSHMRVHYNSVMKFACGTPEAAQKGHHTSQVRWRGRRTEDGGGRREEEGGGRREEEEERRREEEGGRTQGRKEGRGKRREKGGGKSREEGGGKWKRRQKGGGDGCATRRNLEVQQDGRSWDTRQEGGRREEEGGGRGEGRVARGARRRRMEGEEGLMKAPVPSTWPCRQVRAFPPLPGAQHGEPLAPAPPQLTPNRWDGWMGLSTSPGIPQHLPSPALSELDPSWDLIVSNFGQHPAAGAEHWTVRARCFACG
eukprot:424403-Hanusia_phi.AAC.3